MKLMELMCVTSFASAPSSGWTFLEVSEIENPAEISFSTFSSVLNVAAETLTAPLVISIFSMLTYSGRRFSRFPSTIGAVPLTIVLMLNQKSNSSKALCSSTASSRVLDSVEAESE